VKPENNERRSVGNTRSVIVTVFNIMRASHSDKKQTRLLFLKIVFLD
jgi:hypothetical protein